MLLDDFYFSIFHYNSFHSADFSHTDDSNSEDMKKNINLYVTRKIACFLKNENLIGNVYFSAMSCIVIEGTIAIVGHHTAKLREVAAAASRIHSHKM